SRASRVAAITGALLISTSAAAAADVLPDVMQSALARVASHAGLHFANPRDRTETIGARPSRPSIKPNRSMDVPHTEQPSSTITAPAAESTVVPPPPTDASSGPSATGADTTRSASTDRAAAVPPGETVVIVELGLDEPPPSQPSLPPQANGN